MKSKSKDSKDSKASMATVPAIDPSKPVVKDFVDKDQEVIAFVKLMIPHVPYASAKVICVRKSKDGSELCFRVNWYVQIYDTMIVTNKITQSNYVTVKIKPGGGYEIGSIL